uniref:Large ribosomal subunit protein mL54 n=1 Tax=Caenorhabditis tropicalis TaxID=1561998 RepID=A0A1I7UD35_9PELO
MHFRGWSVVSWKSLRDPTGKPYFKFKEDAVKLATHVCINAYIQGEEPGPKILPNSEYPDWLFKLDLRAPRELEDLDPEKDGWMYWRALRKRQIEQNQRIQKLKTKFLHLQNSPSMKKK